MKKIQYKDQNNKNYIKIVIVLFVVIFILLFVQLILSNLQKENNNEISYSSLRTVKDVIEYYDSTYISEEESGEENFYWDIYLKFKFLPYNEDDTSNEEYYNNLLGDVAKILRYANFKMLDTENGITVKVICKNNEIDSIIINDIEDYFIYMDSQISMKEYIEIPTTDFAINSPILQTCIDSNWSKDINFGTRESIFEEYFIYFDEGIKVRIIDNKIYNVIFDKNYKENVINNIFPGMDIESIELNLGKATFKNNDQNLIGYKGNNMYVFFTNSEISIYRNPDIDTDDFFDLADDFIAENIDLLDFMNELTYLWPDYSDYEYSQDSMFISYPLKGIEIKLNYDDMSGILVYNNIKSNMSKIQGYLENTNFVARLQIDSVFEAEQRRVKNLNSQLEKCSEYKKDLEEEKINLIGESFRYDIYPETDANGNIYSMKFISLSEDNPSRELNDSIDYYMWISNDYFVYSKKGKGIYLYNLTNGNVSRVINGSETYEIKEFKDGILKYDDNQEVIISY